MKRKIPQTKPLYSPPRLTVVGSVAGLTTRVAELAREDVDGARFDLGYDDPGRRSVPPVLH